MIVPPPRSFPEDHRRPSSDRCTDRRVASTTLRSSGTLAAMGTSLTRRSVVVAAGVGAVGALLPRMAEAASPAFAHGVASGDPMPDSVLLWTRVTPASDASPGSGIGPV